MFVTMDYLPDDAFVLAASYLSPRERALFAILSRCCNPQVRQPIVSQTSWVTIYVGVLQEDVASKLNDNGDLALELSHIDADQCKDAETVATAGISPVVKRAIASTASNADGGINVMRVRISAA